MKIIKKPGKSKNVIVGVAISKKYYQNWERYISKNWKIYCDLYSSFSKVDYTQLLETEDNTTGIEEISCAGGACLI